MRYAPRPYQRAAIDRLRAALRNRPCLVAPTGSGKSFMGALMLEELGLPALWLAHRKELVEQAADHLRGLGLYVGVIKAGVAPDPLAPVQVASVQTLINRDKPPAGVIVIDEAHHAAAETYGRILSCYPQTPVVGLTATPFRLDGRGLGDLFGELLVAAWTDDLCDEGVLHAPRVYAAASPDLSGVKIVAGDYQISQLAERANTPKLTGDIVRNWLERAGGARTVAFAVDVAHSQQITSAFQDAGVAAEHIDGRTPADLRGAILDRLAGGETTLVSNCQVLTEGWDLPLLECTIIARPTASLTLHIQMIGRVMRSCDGKRGALVFDHAGNHHRHGLVTRRLEYSLGTTSVGTSEPLGLRRCRACGLYFATTKFACPECGWVPTVEEVGRRQIGVSGPGSLEAFDDSTFEYRAMAWAQIEQARESACFADGWSAHQYKDRFGEWPLVGPARDLIDPSNATREQKQHVYEGLLHLAQKKGFREGWASYRYRDYFGVWPVGFVSTARAVSRVSAMLMR